MRERSLRRWRLRRAAALASEVAVLPTGSESLPRPFAWCSGALALAFFAVCVALAGRSWFAAEDFYHLILAQDPTWTWGQIFGWEEGRRHFVYRPIGYDGWFKVAFPIFGLQASAYFLATIALHFATAGLVARLARKLGFAGPVAILTGLLCVSLAPVVATLFRVVMFSYACASFFLVLGLSLFYEAARNGGGRRPVAPLVCFVIALLSNEFAVGSLAAWVLLSWHADGCERSRAAGLRSLRRTAPYLVSVAVYLPLRLIALNRGGPELYAQSLGPHVLENLVWMLSALTGSVRGAWVASLCAAGVLAAALASERGRAAMARWLPEFAVCGGWTLGMMVPFLGMAMPQDRFAAPASVPFALTLGCIANLAYGLWGERRPALIQAGFLAFAVGMAPFEVVSTLYREPEGAGPRQIYVTLRERDPAPGTRVRVLYGAPERGNRTDAERLSRLVYGGGFLPATFKGRRFGWELLRVESQAGPEVCGHCIDFDLLPGGGLAPVDRR